MSHGKQQETGGSVPVGLALAASSSNFGKYSTTLFADWTGNILSNLDHPVSNTEDKHLTNYGREIAVHFHRPYV